MNDLKMKIRKQVQLQSFQKNNNQKTIKYLGINSTKEVQDK